MEMNLVKLLVDLQRRSSDARIQRSTQGQIELSPEFKDVFAGVDGTLEVDGDEEGAEVAGVG